MKLRGSAHVQLTPCSGVPDQAARKNTMAHPGIACSVWLAVSPLSSLPSLWDNSSQVAHVGNLYPNSLPMTARILMSPQGGFTEIISYSWSKNNIETKIADRRSFGGSFNFPEQTNAWNLRKNRSKSRAGRCTLT